MSGSIYIFDKNIVKEQCPDCGSVDSIFDESDGFYNCNTCKNMWGFYEIDSDCRELETCQNCNGSGYELADYSYEPHEVKTICSFCDSEGVV